MYVTKGQTLTDPQDILLHSRMVNKWAKNCDTEKLNLSEKLSVEYQ